MNQRAIDSILRLSSLVYGEDIGPQVANRIISLMAERQDRLNAVGAIRKEQEKPAQFFSEKDALLITYGNMLSGADSNSALGRLAAFLHSRANGLFTYTHMLPFFPYSSDDGFSVIDYREVDERIGSWSDVERLGLDFKLAFDLVLNHGSAKSEWFKAFLEGKKPYDSWYLTRPEGYDEALVFRPRTHPLFTSFHRSDGSVARVWTTFSADQVDFDFGNPDVLFEFIKIFLDYVERGARLIRLDAVAFLWKEDGTTCLHHPKTHAVVKLLRSIAEAMNLDLVILTETNVPHADNISYYGDGDEAHMVYNFALPPLLLHAAVSGDAAPLRKWAAALQGAGAGPVFLNFTASHDGIGVGPAKGLVEEKDFKRTMAEVERRGGKISYKTTPAGPIPYELNCVYMDAVAPANADTETRARAFLGTQAVMLALAGLPAVYFHSWIGSRNWIDGQRELGYARAINREKPDIAGVEKDLSDPTTLRSLVHDGFAKLLRFRAARPAFAVESDQRVLPAEGAVFALVRGPDTSGCSVLCAQNLGPRAAPLALPAEFGSGKLQLAPWQTRWIDSHDKEILCI